jgi:hypothetical protein
MMTPLEWLAFFFLLISALAAGAVVTVSNGAVTGAIRRLEGTYRRHKSQEMELAMERELSARREQLRARLAGEPDAWREVVSQLLVDARVDFDSTTLDVEKVYADPAPCLVISAVGWRYLFTTDPDRLRDSRAIRWRDRVVPLDAALSPCARVEAQALWDHVARELRTGQTTLPRDVAWYLVVHEESSWRPRVRRKWWRMMGQG